jgi:hypothetical protein
MNDEVTKLKLQIENLYKKDMENRLELDYLRRDRDLFKTMLVSNTKRLDALEHPNMDEPLRAFQKLRNALQKVEEANIP